MLTSLVLFAVDNSGVIIVVIIVSILLLAILGSVFYFLYKKGKLPCGRSGKQEMYVILFSPFYPVYSYTLVQEFSNWLLWSARGSVEKFRGKQCKNFFKNN